MDEFDDDFEYGDEDDIEQPARREEKRESRSYQTPDDQIHYPNYEGNDEAIVGEQNPEIGELSVDVINQPDTIIIRAIVAGVKPHDLDVQISRDMVTITGSREDSIEIEEQDYFHRELYWGSFSRNIILPEEIDVEESNASEKHGMLEITLPKIDKNKKTKLQVKSG